MFMDHRSTRMFEGRFLLINAWRNLGKQPVQCLGGRGFSARDL